MKLTKKELRELYKDSPKTLFLLGISLTSDGTDDNDIVDTDGIEDMIDEDEDFEFYNKEVDNYDDDYEDWDSDLAILEDEGY